MIWRNGEELFALPEKHHKTFIVLISRYNSFENAENWRLIDEIWRMTTLKSNLGDSAICGDIKEDYP